MSRLSRRVRHATHSIGAFVRSTAAPAVKFGFRQAMDNLRGQFGKTWSQNKYVQRLHGYGERFPGLMQALQATPLGKVGEDLYSRYNPQPAGDTTSGAMGTTVPTNLVARGEIADAMGIGADVFTATAPGLGLLRNMWQSPVQTAEVMDEFGGDLLNLPAMVEPAVRGTMDFAGDTMGVDVDYGDSDEEGYEDEFTD